MHVSIWIRHITKRLGKSSRNYLEKKCFFVRHGIQICGGNWHSLRVCVCSLVEGFLVNQILWCCRVFSTNNRIRAPSWRKSMRNCIVYIRFACNFLCLISNYEFVCARKIEWSKCIWQMPDHVNPIYSNEEQTSVQFFDGTLTFIRNTISILLWFGADLVNVVSCVCHHFYDAYALLLLPECFSLFCQTTCIFSPLCLCSGRKMFGKSLSQPILAFVDKESKSKFGMW